MTPNRLKLFPRQMDSPLKIGRYHIYFGRFEVHHNNILLEAPSHELTLPSCLQDEIARR